ncbi:hypothetical protein ACWF8U_03080 [Streptomyces olivaceus]|uniref:hypothetical protein n=1 Tax=Streptomyces olivaceus TaxID=47716 RepID=UPI001CCCAC06|nr:hypothetical protein [Streptomyces olivaceus]MBZ6289859.1 hypothetical protein [Streptomyces olivaceus]MBZ6328247.1 hypothetical protein [Streptomyces olivaceus]
MTRTPFEAAAPRQVPYAFQYTVPDEFVRLPDLVAVEGWDEALERLVPDADEEQLASATQQMRAALPGLSAGGEDTVDLTAMCLGTEDVAGEERLSMGLLAVTVKPNGHRDRLLTAEGIYRAKHRRFFAGEHEPQELDFDLGKGVQGRQDMLLAVKLPSGPAVMSASLRLLTLPASLVAESGVAGADGADEVIRPTLPVASLQLIVPAPRDYCVYVTISTPSVFLLDSYCGRLAQIGRTFTFDVEKGSR